VLLNAAAVLVVAGIAKNLADGIRRAAESIDSGAVVRLIVQLQR
jgi:anthranilate phosphoribosyltransferase